MGVVPHPFGWTDPRIALLTQLWADGLSGTQIACEMGGLSRNAVIGKVHRLGLPERLPGTNCNRAHLCKPNNAPKRKHQRKPASAKLVPFARKAPVRADTAHIPPISDLDIPPEQRKSILDLTNTTCRWPVNDVGSPDFYFCGAEGADLTDHRPYCPAHSARARQPATSATRKIWRGGY